MTLSEIAEFVCAKVGQTDAESVARAKLFCAQRYQMIWDSSAWRDSLGLFTATTVTVGGTVAGFIAPSGIERVRAVRSAGTTTLGVVEPGIIFDLDSELWESTGQPIAFLELPKVAHGAGYSVTSGPLRFVAADAADIGKTIIITYELTTGEVVREEATVGDVDALYNVAVGATEILTISKGVTVGAINIYPQEGSYVPAQMTAAQREVPRNVRVRLIGSGVTTTAILALGKRVFPKLSSDDDVPQLQNIDNALLAYVQADMLERGRQYAKALAKAEEAGAHLKIARDLEKNQSAYVCRIIPHEEGNMFDLESTGFTSKSHW